MKRLSPAQAATRRALDYRLMQRLNEGNLVQLTAHGSAEELKRHRVIDDSAGLRGEAQYYLAEFNFPVLIGPQQTTDRALLLFDVSSERYPFSEPRVSVISKPLPWSPHVLPGSGTVCIGEAWSAAKGRMLLPQLVVHLCRVLNCDEPDRGPPYVGWNGEAVAYWRDVLRCQPLTPNLEYPVVPVDITHGVDHGADSSFTPITSMHDDTADFGPVGMGVLR